MSNSSSLPRHGLATREPAAAPQQKNHPHRKGWVRAHWPAIKRVLTLAFFLGVGWLLLRYARTIDWDDVWRSLTSTPAPALALAMALAASSHLLYSCFDLIGRRYTGHTLGTRQVMAVNFVSYAFNLCIGSIVGGVGFRYRLYSRLGLKPGVITRIVSMSMLTNWLGYKLLAGFLFLVHPLPLPPSWHLGNHGMQWIGVGLMAVSLAYILACWKAGDRVFKIRGHQLYLPPWRMAILQMAISCANWSLMAGVIHVLLGQQLPYTDVVTVLLVGAIVGVVAHVPAGLGVFEFVFVALLSHRVPAGQLIAALLGYRALYYIGPLIVASMMYLVMEIRSRRAPKQA
jgi:uncharacterized membrane protein YbhN (UPF0104 family)